MFILLYLQYVPSHADMIMFYGQAREPGISAFFDTK